MTCPICQSKLHFSDEHIDIGISGHQYWKVKCERGHEFIAREELASEDEIELRRLPKLDRSFIIKKEELEIK